MLALAVMPAQSQTPSTPKPSFDVASIKGNTSRSVVWSFGPRGNRFVAKNMTLQMLLLSAYRETDDRQMVANQIDGGPNWVVTDHFDIEAKLEGDGQGVPLAQMRLMVQSLLEDRFRLKAHRETRERRVYELVVAKGGPRLRLSKDQTPPAAGAQLVQLRRGAGTGSGDELESMPRGTTKGSGGASGFTLLGNAVPISAFINLLQPIAGRVLIDKTGLKGFFDFRVTVKLEADPAPPGQSAASPTGSPISAEEQAGTPPASFFAAFEDQLGLKLESTRAPVEVFVIDSVQKPEKN